MKLPADVIWPELPDLRTPLPDSGALALKQWLEMDALPEALKRETLETWKLDPSLPIEDAYAACSEAEQASIDAHMLKSLGFGTAGLRGIRGPGFNRMNEWTVATCIQALSDVLLSAYSTRELEERPVVIGYDTRHGAEDFAKLTARVLAANGIAVYLSDHDCPTPIVAYATRELESVCGLMVTASHNPREYSGIKVYEASGIQMGEAMAEAISRRRGDHYLDLPDGSGSELIQPLPETLEASYLEGLIDLYPPTGIEGDLRIVYTSMHGTGARLVLPLLAELGFSQVFPVEEQVKVDPDFTTAPAPNPEQTEAMALALRDAKKHQADLVLATDPDADRLSVMVPNAEGEWVHLTGNQLGGLLSYYYIQDLKARDALPEGATLVVTIVSDDLGETIAKDQGVHVVRSLTGFKNICGKIKAFADDDQHTYIMGYEESIGYALGTRVLDKDGISALSLLASVAAREKAAGSSIWERLCHLQERFGYFVSKPLSHSLKGADGDVKKALIMATFREAQGPSLPFEASDEAAPELRIKEDYLELRRFTYTYEGDTVMASSEAIHEQASDVLIFRFTDGSWFALRPSGTEPKLKFYFYGHHADADEAERQADRLVRMAHQLMETL